MYPKMFLMKNSFQKINKCVFSPNQAKISVFVFWVLGYNDRNKKNTLFFTYSNSKDKNYPKMYRTSINKTKMLLTEKNVFSC